MKYSPIKELEEKLLSVESALAGHGIFFEKLKDVPYGVQLSINGQEGEGRVAIYYSPKRNAFTISEMKFCDATRRFILCVEGKTIFPQDDLSFQPHFGSDEVGKGDFFGPLITAAFYVDSPEACEDLIKLGVCDSKKLNDMKIIEIAQILHSKYKRNIALVRPAVEVYNEMYTKFKNLNVLLGAMHAMAFDDLKRCFPKVKQANFDKFADVSLVTRFMIRHQDLKINAIVNGENHDIAIAAASILARDCFLKRIAVLSRKYNLTFPLGAGEPVISAGKIFLKKYGREKLKYVAKTHFQTTDKLC